MSFVVVVLKVLKNICEKVLKIIVKNFVKSCVKFEFGKVQKFVLKGI
jgi:hypothetical protein